jgi:hypothetical protein
MFLLTCRPGSIILPLPYSLFVFLRIRILLTRTVRYVTEEAAVLVMKDR